MKKIVLFALIPIAIVSAAIMFYLESGRYVTTENAYVRAGMIMISSNVSGEVAEVVVEENDTVKSGDVLFVLEQAPFNLAVAGADATLRDARNTISILKAGLARQQTELLSVNEVLTYEEAELQRLRGLEKRDVVSQVSIDSQNHTVRVARNRVQSVQADIQKAFAELGGDPDEDINNYPQVLKAVVTYEKTLLDRQYSTIRAKVDGVVARIELHPGEYIRAGASVFSIVETDNIWIEANLKETQLSDIRIGLKANLIVDAFPDKKIEASVSSMSPASGSEYAILPPQNATGNWVKITQRVPVRLELIEQNNSLQLRSGMSVKVSIDTQKERTLNSLISKLMGKLTS